MCKCIWNPSPQKSIYFISCFNHIHGVMVSVLALRGFKIGVGSESGHSNVSEKKATSLHADCCFCKLSLEKHN